MSLELKRPELSLRPKQHFDQLPQRNLDLIKEKHLEQQRIPTDVSPLKILWTLFVATYFLIRSRLGS